MIYRESIDYDLARMDAKEIRYTIAIEEAIANARLADEGEASEAIYATLKEHGYDWLSVEELAERGDLPEDLLCRLENEEGYKFNYGGEK